MQETIQQLQHLLDEKHSNKITMATVAEGWHGEGRRCALQRTLGPTALTNSPAEHQEVMYGQLCCPGGVPDVLGMQAAPVHPVTSHNLLTMSVFPSTWKGSL